jgi:phosphoribosylpyrophosphate synthetase
MATFVLLSIVHAIFLSGKVELLFGCSVVHTVVNSSQHKTEPRSNYCRKRHTIDTSTIVMSCN